MFISLGVRQKSQPKNDFYNLHTNSASSVNWSGSWPLQQMVCNIYFLSFYLYHHTGSPNHPIIITIKESYWNKWLQIANGKQKCKSIKYPSRAASNRGGQWPADLRNWPLWIGHSLLTIVAICKKLHTLQEMLVTTFLAMYANWVRINFIFYNFLRN